MINKFKLDEIKNILGALVIAILLIFFYNKISIDKEEYYNVLNKLNQIKELNSKLYGDIFLTKYRKIKHYDIVVNDMKSIKNSSIELATLMENIDDKTFKINYEEYLKHLELKSIYLHNLISHLAVFNNFISYYPTLSTELSNYFGTSNPQLGYNILKLHNNILINDDSLNKKYLEILNDITNNIDKYNEKDKKLLEYLVSYTKNTITYKNEIDVLEDKFIKLNLGHDLNLLINNYKIYFYLIQKDEEIYLFYIIVLSILLLLGIVYFIVNLNKANRKVKDTLNELKFQKLALDEHSIVSIADAKGKITYVNEKFCQISGYSFEELIGKNHRILKSDEHDNDFFKNLWQTITSGKTWHGEVKNFKKNGGFYWVNATVVPFLNDENKPFQYISIRTDITGRKDIENNLTDAKILAEEANKIKSDFLSNMSHELRTPLNGVIGMSQIALDNEKDKKQRSYLEKINSSGNILLKIINDLLDYSKIEAGKLSIENIGFNIDDVLQNVADLITIKAYEKNLEVIFNRDVSIPKIIIGDSLRTIQILVNIISNAIKFTDKGEVILDVKVKNIDDRKINLEFLIKDTGIGINEKILHTIFNSFTQADNSISRKYGGTGLGLTITKNLIELMGGSISVLSKINVGTTFILNVPFGYEKDIDYNITNDIEIKLFDLSNPIKLIIKDILKLFKIKCEEVSNLDFEISKNIKYVVLTENENCVTFFPTLLISNPNKILINVSGNIKIISKPINPSLIYNSILELIDVNSEILDKSLINQVKKCQGVNVLLVEDNPINQTIATLFLESFGCNVKVANNGLEAVNLLKKENNIDIVFMDIQMPVMNGYEATTIIRDELKLDLPIIAMTANTMSEDIKKVKEIGMNRHIGKPINKKEIEDAIINLVL